MKRAEAARAELRAELDAKDGSIAQRDAEIERIQAELKQSWKQLDDFGLMRVSDEDPFSKDLNAFSYNVPKIGEKLCWPRELSTRSPDMIEKAAPKDHFAIYLVLQAPFSLGRVLNLFAPKGHAYNVGLSQPSLQGELTSISWRLISIWPITAIRLDRHFALLRHEPGAAEGRRGGVLPQRRGRVAPRLLRAAPARAGPHARALGGAAGKGEGG